MLGKKSMRSMRTTIFARRCGAAFVTTLRPFEKPWQASWVGMRERISRSTVRWTALSSLRGA
jgi:hypothetical protein